MNRRELLVRCAATAALTWEARAQSSQAQAVKITIDTHAKRKAVPADFTGLGYEISSVAIPGLLSAQNRTYVQLVRNLGADGVIRIGGNTSDFASFQPGSNPVSKPSGTIINAANLQDLGTFLDATGWRLIWGLNLGHGNQKEAVEEAEAVAAAANGKLLAFEIGNEPDLFGHRMAHRPSEYRYEDYLAEYRRFKAAIRSKLPRVPFAGPDVASATDWLTRFAGDEGKDLKLLTHHYYRECASATSTLEKLLYPDPKLVPELAKLQTASSTSQVPYRICETNSFCGGGKPGVSDTFGAALWVLDFMLRLASAGCAGVNIETGVNQLGFVSSYSPITGDGATAARAAYYGMLAFAQAVRGPLLNVDCDAAGLNLASYASAGKDSALTITLINKDQRNADVMISTKGALQKGSVLRLAAPSLTSKEGITLGGSAAKADGKWDSQTTESVKASHNRCEIHMPAGSAAIVSFGA